ncbi:MAG: dihydroorotase [Erysipelotrichaceae bacterium]|nr:dihydroorotase [Erysipelotrichaceae bacterium]
MTILIKNAMVFYQDQFSKLDLYIDEHQHLNLASVIRAKVNEVIDASGLHIFPGLIDVHTHLRQPGFEYKETIKTGTLAAAKGGYTTICCMPNLKPVTDSVETYDALLKLIEQDALISVLPYASITKAELGTELVDIESLSQKTHFFSDDGKGVQNEIIMRQAMIAAHKYGAMIVAHCEDESLLEKDGSVHEGILVDKYGQIKISSASEYQQLARDLKLVKETGCKYHACHLSTKESIYLIRQAKRDGLNVTCEVTPHHLLLCENDVTIDDGMYKMNPPLRTKEDQEALLAGLLDNTIDMIATDHAPHSKAEKAKGLSESAFGVIGLDFAFSLLYKNLVLTKKVALIDLIHWMSRNPARVFNIQGGSLKLNELANLVIFDLNEKGKITEDSILSKSHNTPFINNDIQAMNKMTIVNGKIVYRKGI